MNKIVSLNSLVNLTEEDKDTSASFPIRFCRTEKWYIKMQVLVNGKVATKQNIKHCLNCLRN